MSEGGDAPLRHFAVFGGKAGGVYATESEARAKDKRAQVREFADSRAATIYCMSGVFGPEAGQRDPMPYRSDEVYKSIAYLEGSGGDVLLVLGVAKTTAPLEGSGGHYTGRALLLSPNGEHRAQEFESVCADIPSVPPGTRGEMMGTLFKSLWCLLALLYGKGAREPAEFGGALPPKQRALISLAVKGTVAYLTCGRMNFWPFLKEVRTRVPYLPLILNESAASAQLLRMIGSEEGKKK